MRLPESSRRGSLRERGRLSPVGSVRGLLTGSASGQPGSGTEWRSWPALGGRGSQCPCADLGDFTPPSHASLPLVPGTVASFLPPPPPLRVVSSFTWSSHRGLASRSLQTAAALPPPPLSLNPQRADALPVRHVPLPVGLARRWLGVLSHARGGQGSAHL